MDRDGIRTDEDGVTCPLEIAGPRHTVSERDIQNLYVLVAALRSYLWSLGSNNGQILHITTRSVHRENFCGDASKKDFSCNISDSDRIQSLFNSMGCRILAHHRQTDAHCAIS